MKNGNYNVKNVNKNDTSHAIELASSLRKLISGKILKK